MKPFESSGTLHCSVFTSLFIDTQWLLHINEKYWIYLYTSNWKMIKNRKVSIPNLMEDSAIFQKFWGWSARLRSQPSRSLNRRIPGGGGTRRKRGFLIFKSGPAPLVTACKVLATARPPSLETDTSAKWNSWKTKNCRCVGGRSKTEQDRFGINNILILFL